MKEKRRGKWRKGAGGRRGGGGEGKELRSSKKAAKRVCIKTAW